VTRTRLLQTHGAVLSRGRGARPVDRYLAPLAGPVDRYLAPLAGPVDRYLAPLAVTEGDHERAATSFASKRGPVTGPALASVNGISRSAMLGATSM
jgi:hypothetical protein